MMANEQIKSVSTDWAAVRAFEIEVPESLVEEIEVWCETSGERAHDSFVHRIDALTVDPRNNPFAYED